VWDVGAHDLEHCVQAFSDQNPEAEPDDRGDYSDRQSLGHDAAEHLASACSQRSQGCELAGALGDCDRERVEDHEGAYENRDQSERE